MKITKLPDNIDGNMLVENVVKESNMKCPFCGNEKEYDLFAECLGKDTNKDGVENTLYGISWYGHRDEPDNPFSFLKFWEKNRHWAIMSFKCHACGAKWQSDPYPTDVAGYLK